MLCSFTVIILAFLTKSTLQELTNPHLHWRTVLDDRTDPEKAPKPLCKVPVSSGLGRYIVIDKPDSKPGDVIEKVSLLYYSTDVNNTYVQIQAYTCDSGQWKKEIFEYLSEKVYFNTTWCPVFCPPSDKDNVEGPKLSTSETYQAVGENTKNDKMCRVPPYPNRGNHLVWQKPKAKPGDIFQNFTIYSYRIVEKNIFEITQLYCVSGKWYTIFFKQSGDKLFFMKTWCSRMCSPSLADESSEPPLPLPLTNVASRISDEQKNQSKCELPAYPKDGTYTVENRPGAGPGQVFDSVRLDYSCDDDKKMFGSKSVYCIDGVWYDETPKCIACGAVKSAFGDYTNTSEDDALRKELPWHVAIYNKDITPYRLICSGSIIASNMVLTAAHCFWNDATNAIEPPSRFAVAAGKIYRDWDNPLDTRTQESEVSEIRVHPKFRGLQDFYKNDIALILLTTPIVYNDYIIPVCIDFDVNSDEKQLKSGSFEKVASWGPTDGSNGNSSKLQVDWLPYVDTKTCIVDASPAFRQYVATDKICAGDVNGTRLCDVDGGGGMSSRVWKDQTTRVYYLRGIVSVTPKGDDRCNLYAVNTFTHVIRHEKFIKQNFKAAIW